MRDLASVVTIETKNKMFEKDKICVVTFKELGYEAIVPIEYNVGDKMIFIQEGSILPVEPRWEFLRKRCFKPDLNGFLIKPMTMGAKDINGEKGERVKSWGLCVSLEECGLKNDLKSGTDVTEKLKIKKYEPQEELTTRTSKTPKFIQFCLSHKILRWIGNLYLKTIKPERLDFPTDVIYKSDETTIQNCKYLLDTLQNTSAFITCKMEGQSFTCSLDKKTKKFYICSRNNRYNKPCETAADYFKAAKKYDIENQLKKYYKQTGNILVIQGEQCGPGIQGNIYNFDELTWFVFRVKEIINGKSYELNYEEMSFVLEKLGLQRVPLFKYIPNMSKYNTIDSLVKLAETASWTPDNLLYKPKQTDKMWKNYLQHEGIVVKSTDYNKENGTGYSFKVKNMAYQEKQYSEMNKIARGLQHDN